MDIRAELPPGDGWLVDAVRRGNRWSLWRDRVFAVTVAALGVVVFILVPDLRDVDLAVALVASGGFVLVAVRQQPRLSADAAPRFVRTEPSLVEIGEVTIRQTFLSARAEYTWAAFDRVSDTPAMWILHVGTRQALYLPKSAFGTGDRERLAVFLAGLSTYLATARVGATAR